MTWCSHPDCAIARKDRDGAEMPVPRRLEYTTTEYRFAAEIALDALGIFIPDGEYTLRVEAETSGNQKLVVLTVKENGKIAGE